LVSSPDTGCSVSSLGSPDMHVTPASATPPESPDTDSGCSVSCLGSPDMPVTPPLAPSPDSAYNASMAAAADFDQGGGKISIELIHTLRAEKEELETKLQEKEKALLEFQKREADLEIREHLQELMRGDREPCADMTGLDCGADLMAFVDEMLKDDTLDWSLFGDVDGNVDMPDV